MILILGANIVKRETSIENAMIVSSNEWKYVASLELKASESLPLVPCLPGEFNQVILNLIINAAHAIAAVKYVESGQLGKIATSIQEVGASVEIRGRTPVIGKGTTFIIHLLR